MQPEDFRIIQSLIRDAREEIHRLTLRLEKVESQLKIKPELRNFDDETEDADKSGGKGSDE